MLPAPPRPVDFACALIEAREDRPHPKTTYCIVRKSGRLTSASELVSVAVSADGRSG